MKLTRTYTIFFGAATIIIAVVLNLFIWNEIRTFLLQEIEGDLDSKMSLARKIISGQAFLEKDSSMLNKEAREIRTITDLRITFIDREGKVLADSDVPADDLEQVENHLYRPEVQQALRKDVGFDIRTSATIGEKLIYYCQTLRHEGRVIGFLRFAMFSSDFNTKLDRLRTMLLKMDVIFLLLAAAGIILFNRHISGIFAPLVLRLRDRRESGAFASLPSSSWEEIDALVAGWNRIGERLQEEIENCHGQCEQMYNIFNSLNEGVAAFDQQGNPLVYNGMFQEILELTNTPIEGRPFYDWIRFPPLMQDIEGFLKEGEKVKRRIKYYHDTFIEYQILPAKAQGTQNFRFLVTIQDVTHLQLLETIRQDFVANVSHEFKTPLTSIRGYTETILSGLGDDEVLRDKFLRKIEKQTHHLENLVSDLLQLSQIEKREVSDIVRMDPLPVVADIAEEFLPLAKKDGMILQTELPAKIPAVYIMASENLIHTLLSNLLSNAIHYSRKGGKIRLYFGLEENNLLLEVEDEGIGIPRRQQQRIFERFYRLPDAQEYYPEGTGLGLSIVRHIVGLLHAQIHLESAPGKGSRFRVLIPLTK